MSPARDMYRGAAQKGSAFEGGGGSVFRSCVPTGLCLGVLLTVAGIAGAERPVHRISRIDAEITVDGVLDEPAWEDAAIVEIAWETWPGENLTARVRTECRLAFDDDSFYVGCRAFDPEPHLIRAHLTDRDAAFDDDFVGVILDTFDDERRAYEFFVNPLGVQMDLVRDDVNRREDSSWDAIWQSAGRIVDEGYEVEMAIPVSQLRFCRGQGEMRWGMSVSRIYPRNQRYVLASQPKDRDRACEICQYSYLEGLDGLVPGRNLEIAPTVTGQYSQEREELTDPELETVADDIEAGLNVRWGFTPNLTLNAALNPDFSQVEADVAQLDVNTQFALFYPEKRPFFLESADYYDTPIRAVYTRTVADPAWGLRVTGKEGPNALGVYVAEDDVTNLVLPGAEDSDLESLEQKNLTGVVRWRRDLGGNSSVGVLATARDGEDYSNAVVGIDGLVRFGPSDWMDVQALWSETEYPDVIHTEYDQPEGAFSDSAIVLRYQHLTRDWYWRASYQDYGEGFRADSGFVPQVDFRRLAAGVERRLWGEPDGWWARAEIGADWDRTETQDGFLFEEEYEAWFNFSGPRQSFAMIRGGFRDRGYEGQRFDQTYLGFYGEVYAFSNLYTSLGVHVGDQLDFANVRNGDRVRLEPEITWRAGRHLRLELHHTYEHLDVEGGRLFTANLAELRGVWQFTTRTFVRVILQYTHVDRDLGLYDDPEDLDACTRRLFSQLLFSYKLNPQTVFFLGYSDAQRGNDVVDSMTANRTVFVKVGYVFSL